MIYLSISLLIYICTLIYYVLILMKKIKIRYEFIVGLIFSYAAFGLAFVIENYPG